jgi:hypothetical protein
MVAVNPETDKDGLDIPPKMIEYLLGLLCTIEPSDEVSSLSMGLTDNRYSGILGRDERF